MRAAARRRRLLLGVWLLLLAASWTFRLLYPRDPPPAPRGLRSVTLPSVDGAGPAQGGSVELRFRVFGPPHQRPLGTVLLLHGSPGRHQELTPLALLIGQRYRAIVPDLPGFGASTHDLPDYSMRAHARYVLALLDALREERVHVLGFSMGGGVGLELWELAPERVASLVLLSSIGVQELELLGDYHLNHALHGLQLAAIALIDTFVPHFGWFDRFPLGVPYARNFYDSDQRPLRGILERFEPPALILHGEHDVLVPAAAAREHGRLLPQSELVLLDDGHFLLFRRPQDVARRALLFFAAVDRGLTPSRASAPPERVAAARASFDPRALPPSAGLALVVLMALLALATLVSEDLTCLAAGLLAAWGRLSFGEATAACLAGIWIGDLGLFAAGRWLGRPVLTRAPLRYFVSARDVERSSRWLEQRGLWVIGLSRFAPGTRLPTYFAAGMLHTRAPVLALYFLIAAAVWTPAAVGLSLGLGRGALAWLGLTRASLFSILLGAAALLLALRMAVPLVRWRGRRLLVGRVRRWLRWEFWPLWFFYLPIAAYIARLALRYRSLLVVTAVNPGIPAGGFAGERKSEILALYEGDARYLLRTELVPAELAPAARCERARAFILREKLAYPLVLKPDVGERGAGVAFAQSLADVETYLHRTRIDTLVQECAQGPEFGVFYLRRPDEAHGRIFSITEKRLPVLRGDGRRTLAELILADERAVVQARHHLRRLAERLGEVPAAGSEVRFVEVGTHSRGALFLDGARHRTPELERAIDEVARGFRGFYFGRFDVRSPTLEEFRAGRFRVVELNGLTSEATHIYDPGYGVRHAYRVLFEQWALAFEIAAANRARGVRRATLRELGRLVARARAERGLHGLD